MRGRARLLVALLAAGTFSGDAAVAQLGGGAAPPKAGISMAGSGAAQKIRYGKRVAISGFVAPRAAGRPVALEYAPRGGAFRPVRAAVTTKGGGYSFSIRPRFSGAYRALVKGSRTATAPRTVTVVARLAGRSRRHVLGAGAVRVRGQLLPRLRGRKLSLQVRTDGRWRTVDRTRTRAGGRFKASFKPRRPGVYRLRVRFPGDGVAAGTSDGLRRVHVYRPGHASWYGPGLYGNSTACGGALHAGRLGVAHRYLPCGTRVTFRYRGRTVTAPVIDRGPFAAGREWDLTAATKHRLGFGDVGTVWSTR